MYVYLRTTNILSYVSKPLRISVKTTILTGANLRTSVIIRIYTFPANTYQSSPILGLDLSNACKSCFLRIFNNNKKLGCYRRPHPVKNIGRSRVKIYGYQHLGLDPSAVSFTISKPKRDSKPRRGS